MKHKMEFAKLVDEETQSYVFNQTMLRIKDPKPL